MLRCEYFSERHRAGILQVKPGKDISSHVPYFRCFDTKLKMCPFIVAKVSNSVQ